MPPGVVHSVVTKENSIYCGFHILNEQMMDWCIEVLRQTEIDPSRTNDVNPAAAFRILENFMCEVLDPNPCGLSKGQLYRLILALKKYCDTPSPSLGQEDILGMDEPQSKRPRTGKKQKEGKRRSVVDDSNIQNETLHRAKRQNFLKIGKEQKWIERLSEKVQQMVR
jgi:hypothetical protein